MCIYTRRKIVEIAFHVLNEKNYGCGFFKSLHSRFPLNCDLKLHLASIVLNKNNNDPPKKKQPLSLSLHLSLENFLKAQQKKKQL